MAFNKDFFQNIQGSIVSDITREQIEDNSSVYVFPFNVKIGAQNISEKGTQGQTARPTNFTDFKKIFTGKSIVIAQWEKAISITSRRQLKYYDYTSFRVFRDIIKINENKDIPFDYKWSEDLKKAMVDNVSYVEYNKNKYLINLEKEIFQFEENILTFDEVLELLRTKEIDFIYRNLELDKEEVRNKLFLNCLYKDYNIGDYYKAEYVSNSSGAIFNTFPSDDMLGNYTQEDTTRSIKLRTTKQIGKDDLFKLYLVPQHFIADPTGLTEEIQWLYISETQENYTPDGEFIFTELTFSSLNDVITKTGQSINSYVQYSSLGEGACLPSLKYDSTGIPNGVKINPIMIKDNGVNTIQIEQIGAAATTAMIVVGRPIEKVGEFNQKIWPSRDLLMADLKYPIPDKLNRQSNPSNKFYLTNMLPEIESYYGSWIEATKANYIDSRVKKFDGWLETSSADTHASNPHDLVIKDNSLNFSGAAVLNRNYDITGNYAFHYSKDNQIDNNKLLNPSKTHQGQVHNIFNLFRFMFTHIITLPMVSKEQITWNLREFPIIGSFLNKITFGLPIYWRQNITNTDVKFPSFQGIPAFVDSNIYDFYNKAFWPTTDGKSWLAKREDNSGRLPLNMFASAESTKMNGLIGSTSNTTSWNFRITDRVYLREIDVKTGEDGDLVKASTIMLGQENQKTPGKAYLYDVDSSAIDTTDSSSYVSDIEIHQAENVPQNFIIDAIGVMAVHDGDIRITAFDQDPDFTNYDEHTIWNTTIQSEAQWTKNIRNWLTLYKTSYLDDFIPDGVFLPFPAPMPQPSPNKNYGDVYLDLGNFTHNDKKTFTSDSFADGSLKYDFEKEIYDFKEKGLTSLEAIKKAYDFIELDVNYDFRSEDSAQNVAGVHDKYDIVLEENKKRTIRFSINDLSTSSTNIWNYHPVNNGNKGGRAEFSISLDLVFNGTKLTLSDNLFTSIIARGNYYKKATANGHINFNITNTRLVAKDL